MHLYLPKHSAVEESRTELMTLGGWYVYVLVYIGKHPSLGCINADFSKQTVEFSFFEAF